MKNIKSQTDVQLKEVYSKIVNSKELFNPKTGHLKRGDIPLVLVREMNKRKLTLAV